jgi:large subunit ribosomal protein L10
VTSAQKAQKVEVVAALNATFASSDVEAVVVVRNDGLTAGQTEPLRAAMRANNVDFKVSKNRLVLRALKGTRFEGIGPMLKGPTVIATSKDPVAAAKIVAKFAKDNEKLIIVGGALGDKVLDKSGIEALSKLPSLDEMRASFLRLLQTPATRLAVLTQKPAEQLARVLKAHAEKA